MFYKEYKPSTSLGHLVDCYWISKIDKSTALGSRIIPDGCVDVIFRFGGDFSTTKSTYSEPILHGTMTSSFLFVPENGISEMLGVRFLPAGISVLTKLPISEITNGMVSLFDIDSLFHREFVEMVYDIPSYQMRIRFIDQWLLAVQHSFFALDVQIFNSLKRAISLSGRIDVVELASLACLSSRQFERRFRTKVGLTPKEFLQVLRFRKAKSLIDHNPQKSVLEVAFECGYYDHSHLNKDFLRFLGEPPRRPDPALLK